MTTISRVCFEPSDIQAIQLECQECGATLSFTLHKWNPRSLECPNCAVTLVTESSYEGRTLKSLADALKSLNWAPDEKRKFRLRFEFAQPSTDRL